MLYHNKFTSCDEEGTRYVLEHVLDYYPYGKTLREYTLQRERFQTTHHERDAETGLDYRGARFYDSEVGRFLSLDPLAMEFFEMSDYNYTLNNPILFIDSNGKAPSLSDPPKTILIFYHGGPDGNGQIHTTREGQTGKTGSHYDFAYRIAESTGRKVIGAIIAPSVTQGPGVRTGIEFLKTHYSEGDQVVVYGYSYGGDNAVNLTERADDAGITIDALVIVDSSDGPGRGLTVDTTIPGNVKETLNVYQTSSSGNSSKVTPLNGDINNSSENHSSDGSVNSPGSRGYPHMSETNQPLTNMNYSDRNSRTTHGNIQWKAEYQILRFIENKIEKYEN